MFLFPYTNFHEINLDWILKEVKKIAEEVASNAGTIEENKILFNKKIMELSAKIENLDVPAEVAEQLRAMIDSGEFDDIFTREMFGILSGWIPSGDDKTDFKNDVLRCAVSHLVHAYGSDAVVPGDGGLVNIDTPFAAVYSNTLTHEAALEFAGSGFITNRYREIGGVELPLAFMDCSSFLTLMDCCRFYGATAPGQYNDSPYYYAFKNRLSGDDPGVIARCVEAGTNHTKPYTFDYLNNIGTTRMAYLMDMSGNKIKLIARRNNLEEAPVFDPVEVANLESGDQLFFGKYDEPDLYKRIGHCGLYVKTLADLNAIGEFYNATFRPVGTGAHPEYGFVVHVTGGSTDGVVDTKYKNTIRIDTLYDAVNEMNNITVYYAKPYSNYMLSSKAQRTFGGMARGVGGTFLAELPEGNDLRNWYGLGDNGLLKVWDININSRQLAAGDLNDIDNGFYYSVAANYVDIANLPDSVASGSVACQVFQIGKRSNGTRGLQLCIVNASGESAVHFYIRTCNTAGTWSRWFELNKT